MSHKVLDIEVERLLNLVAPSKLKGLRDPYVEVHYAGDSLKSPAIKDLKSFEDVVVGVVFHFAYRADENIVRFKVFDRDGRDVGFSDVSLTKYGLHAKTTTTADVKLGSSSGKAGGLTARWRLLEASDKIKPYMTKGSLVPKVVNRAVDDSDSSNDEGETFNSSGDRYKGLQVQVNRAFDLKAKSSTVNPFVVASLGKRRVCGPKLATTGLSPELASQFDLPFNNERYLRLTVYDRESMEVDRKLGVAKVDLKPMERSRDAEHAIESKLKKSMASDKGLLAMKIHFLKDAPASPSATLIPGAKVQTASIPRAAQAAPAMLSGDRGVDSDDSDDEGDRLEGASQFKMMEFRAVKAENVTSHKRHVGEIDPFLRVKFEDGWLRSTPVVNAGKNPDFSSSFHVPFSGYPKTRFELCDDIAVFGSGKCAEGNINLAKIWPRILSGEREIPLVVDMKSTDKKATSTPKMHFLVTPHSTPDRARVVESATRSAKKELQCTPAKRTDGPMVMSREAPVQHGKVATGATGHSVRICIENTNLDLDDGNTFTGTCECQVGQTELATKIKKARLPSFAPGSCFVFPYEGDNRAIITFNTKHGFRGYTPVGGAVIDISQVCASNEACRLQLDLISPSNKKIGDLLVTADRLSYVEKPYSFLMHKQ